MDFSRVLGALFLGLTVGMMAGASVACGTLPALCGPSTCDGCCASGKCVTSPNNARVATCGQAGAACSNCGLKACVDFSCNTGGSGGGTGGACGAGNCGGCCSGVTSSSVCITNPSATNCGGGGKVCKSCSAGEACRAGSCTSVDGGSQVGTRCQTDTECAALGADHVCKKKTSSGANDYLDGYCTRKCVNDLGCPSSALCLGPQPGYGETDSICWTRCTAPTDCRTGYECYPVGGGESACWISPLPPFDPGPPADKVGQPCGTDATCRNPPDDGLCLADKLSDGGMSAFVGGYCSAPCDDSSHCSADAGAVCISLGTFGACAQGCTTPQQGQGSCRTDYVCRSVRSGPDGGLLSTGFCWPSCRSAGCATGSCQASGYCS